MAKVILERLRFPRKQVDEVVKAVRCHMQFKDALEMRKSTLRRLLLRPTFPLELMLCGSCCHSQLSVTVEPDLMFRHYLYVSGTSRTLRPVGRSRRSTSAPRSARSMPANGTSLIPPRSTLNAKALEYSTGRLSKSTKIGYWVGPSKGPRRGSSGGSRGKHPQWLAT